MKTAGSTPNWFVRTMIVVLCIFVAGLICGKFFCATPPYEISAGLIILVAFLTVLILSEVFDNFSISKIISLSRTVTEKEVESKELKKENSELRNQIISISSNMSQRQVLNIGDKFIDALKVRQAETPEKEAELTESAENSEPGLPAPRVSRYKLEDFVLRKFLKDENLDIYPLMDDVKFSSRYDFPDPVSNYDPIFDGYITTKDTEIFIEIKSGYRNISAYRGRLYSMLSKVYYYRTAKKINAFLFLVLVSSPNDEKEVVIDKLLEEFEPARVNGLLKVKIVTVTDAEFSELQKVTD